MVSTGATGPDPRRVYEERRAARQAAQAANERRHHAIGTLRLVGLGIAGALGIGIVGGAGYSGWWLLAPLARVFLLGVRLESDRGGTYPPGTGHLVLRARSCAPGRRLGRNR